MKKYWMVIKNECQRQFSHRANVLTYVVGNFLELSAQVIIWTVIFQSVDIVRGYTYAQMMTYVVIGWFFLLATANYGIEQFVARDIQEGLLSNYIVKPLSYLKYITAFSIGRVSVAFGIAIIEQIVFISIFAKHLELSTDPLRLLIILIMIGLGYFVRLFFSLIIGSIAFWTTEISGTYTSANVAIKFLSGAYFPINLLPAIFTTISISFPFAYTFFVPLQIYLGKMTIQQGVLGIGIEIAWLIILYGLVRLIWKHGLRRYESLGI